MKNINPPPVVEDCLMGSYLDRNSLKWVDLLLTTGRCFWTLVYSAVIPKQSRSRWDAAKSKAERAERERDIDPLLNPGDSHSFVTKATAGSTGVY